MKVTILGTGCIWTKRACASYLINDDILMDVGSGTLKQLFKSSNKLLHHEKIGKIKLILISHYHIDHYFDIVHFMWKIASENNPDFYATIICPPGGEERIKTLCRLGMSESSVKKLNFDKYVKFVDASTMGTFEYGNFEITSKKVDHGDIECYGYIFKEKGGKTIGFTGDSTMCQSVIDIIDLSDVAFVDMAGTDISNKHYNIIDGIELMEKYRGKCCIVPAHLTSQAVDYAEGRINLPKDLMVLDINEDLPYDYLLHEGKSSKAPKNFRFAKKEFEVVEGNIVDLALSFTRSSGMNYKMPTYCFDVRLRDTSQVVGSAVYSVLPSNIEGHASNLIVNLDEKYNMKSINYEVCTLMKRVAKKHGAKCLYLTSDPNDFDLRTVYESLGAYLKEIKTFVKEEKTGERETQEKCVWVWEF